MSRSAEKKQRTSHWILQFLKELAKARGMELSAEKQVYRLTRPEPGWGYGDKQVRLAVHISLIQTQWIWLVRKFEVTCIPSEAWNWTSPRYLRGEVLLGYFGKKLAPAEYDINKHADKDYWTIRSCSDLIALLRNYDEVAHMTGYPKLFTE